MFFFFHSAKCHIRQHYRLSICSYFGWLWQIQNLRRAGMSSLEHHLCKWPSKNPPSQLQSKFSTKQNSSKWISYNFQWLHGFWLLMPSKTASLSKKKLQIMMKVTITWSTMFQLWSVFLWTCPHLLSPINIAIGRQASQVELSPYLNNWKFKAADSVQRSFIFKAWQMRTCSSAQSHKS